MQLRIFEKRYQWLIRQAVEQHGCFAIASGRGFCTAVVVNRCEHGGTCHVLALLLACHVYHPKQAALL